jgi:hypothetical protein
MVISRRQAGGSNFASSLIAAARPVLPQEPSITAECYERMSIVDLEGMQGVSLDKQRAPSPTPERTHQLSLGEKLEDTPHNI